jgi:hypothetical protein
VSEYWRNQVAYLEMLRFSSVGQHYYVHIVFGGDRFDLYYELTTRQAAALNKTDSRGMSIDNVWSKGDRTSRYVEKEHARREAMKQWREMCPDAKALIEGDYVVAEPQMILDGLGHVVEGAANYLFEQCERLGWWDKGNDAEVKRLSTKWHNLIKVTVENLDND